VSKISGIRMLLATAMFALALCASAQAQVTIGQLAPPNPAASCESTTKAYDEVQTSLASGTSYAVPAPGGVITSWSTNATTAGGQLLGLKVFRPTGLNLYLTVAHDGPRALASGVLNTFPASIPVQAGDVIGIHAPISTPAARAACLFTTGLAGDVIGFKNGDVPDGGGFSVEGIESEFRLNLAATVLPPPAVTAITPASGSVKGGTSVAIAGSNFAEVKSVTFGSTPATSYTVGSEGQITAIAPASPTLAGVSVSVTTVAGSATAPQPFVYEGCTVPKLRGKTLKAARKKLGKAKCKLGKVKGDRSKTAKVVKQNPKPGKLLAPGSKVNVKLAE
jgi:hypothetical protein